MPDHNYLPKLHALWRDNPHLRGRLASVTIAHDPWCGIHRGGRCNCDPSVTLAKVHAEPTARRRRKKAR